MEKKKVLGGVNLVSRRSRGGYAKRKTESKRGNKKSRSELKGGGGGKSQEGENAGVGARGPRWGARGVGKG